MKTITLKIYAAKRRNTYRYKITVPELDLHEAQLAIRAAIELLDGLETRAEINIPNTAVNLEKKLRNVEALIPSKGPPP